MKMIQIILGVIAIIIAGILIVALFIKKDYSISTEIIINRPKGIVFDYIKNIRNQEKYSKWVMADPNVKLVYKGTDATVGFVSSWKSEMKNVGVGEQEVTAIKEGERIDMEIRFEKPFKGISTAITTVESVNENQTKYTNTFNTRSPYPMNIMSALMKKMLKKDLDETSARLKKVLESK